MRAFAGASVLGVMVGLGFAPLGWSFLAIVAYPCLYRLIFGCEFTGEFGGEGSTQVGVGRWSLAWRAAGLVYCFYFGVYGVSLFWIGEAPSHFDKQLWWMGILAMFGVPFILSFFAGFAGFVAAWLGSVVGARGIVRMLLLASALAVAEYGRGNLFTGFAWNMPAHLLNSDSALLQNVAWLGLYGGNLVVLGVLILPASLFFRGKRRFIGAGVSLMLMVGFYAYGVWHLQNPVVARAEPYGVRIVQNNVGGAERWESASIARNFTEALELSRKNRPDWVSLVVWGEAVIPFDLTKSVNARRVAADSVPSGGGLISGMTRYVEEDGVFFNSMAAIDDEGDVLMTYDKHHLVPFGEYVPLRDYLPFTAVATGELNFQAGKPPQSVMISGSAIDKRIPAFIPLICYEIIFPHLRRIAYRADEASWILNLVNDEWYEPSLTGIAMGFYQHLQMARFAAVESGLPVVRAVSTGISAVIDRHGRILAQIPYASAGVVDILLPAAKASPSLLYGDSIFIAFLLILWLALGGVLLYIRRVRLMI